MTRAVTRAVTHAATGCRLAIALAAVIASECAKAACPIQVLAATTTDVPPPNDPHEVVVRNIHITNGDVFDPDDPGHDGFIHRLMNAAHIETHEDVIRRQLLFSEGEAVSVGVLAETERYLRANKYLSEASVSLVNCHAGGADIEVETVDAWSLVPSVSFSHKGGRSLYGFRIQETNLLGSGSELRLAYDSDIERDSLGLLYADRHLGDSRVGVFLLAEDTSDGARYALNLEQPFYSIDARRAGAMRFETYNQLDTIYDLGEQVGEVRHDALRFDSYYGWSRGLQSGRALRWTAGIGYDEHRFEPVATDLTPLRVPADRRDVYPYVGVEWLENQYEQTRNEDQILRVEDRHMGTRLGLRLGYATTLAGSMQDALRLEIAASRGFHPLPGSTLLLKSELEYRQPTAGDASHRLQAEARYYYRQSQNRLLFAQLSIAAGENLDTDRQIFLGADNGLRGYPVRYQTGDVSALLTLEQRVFTDWYPLHLFHVGAAAFIDAGRIWRPRAEQTNLGILKDAGIGLRIGSPHSATGRMLHVDLAYAMDGPPEVQGWQLFLTSGTRF